MTRIGLKWCEGCEGILYFEKQLLSPVLIDHQDIYPCQFSLLKFLPVFIFFLSTVFLDQHPYPSLYSENVELRYFAIVEYNYPIATLFKNTLKCNKFLRVNRCNKWNGGSCNIIATGNMCFFKVDPIKCEIQFFSSAKTPFTLPLGDWHETENTSRLSALNFIRPRENC